MIMPIQIKKCYDRHHECCFVNNKDDYIIDKFVKYVENRILNETTRPSCQIFEESRGQWVAWASMIYEMSVIDESVTPNLTTNKRKRQTGEVECKVVKKLKFHSLASQIAQVTCDWCRLSFASRGINKHRFSCKNKPENSDYAYLRHSKDLKRLI